LPFAPTAICPARLPARRFSGTGEKTAHKIDIVVALALAALGAVRDGTGRGRHPDAGGERRARAATPVLDEREVAVAWLTRR
jgi:hypothetical protein